MPDASSPDATRSDVIRVLVVDDSPTFRQLVKLVIAADNRLTVIGEARDGHEAVRKARELRPDVILMDVVMPGLDGLAATREIMGDTPTPIVVVSASVEAHETDIAFQAVKAGALVVLKKPPGPGHADHKTATAQLLNTLRTMSGVRVIHHWKHHQPGGATRPAPASPPQVQIPVTQAVPEIVAIVSSTGGPAALSEIVGNLPADFPLPVVIAQHIAPDFVPALAEWLSRTTSLPINIAVQGGQLQRQGITLSPADAHLRITRGGRIELDTNRELSRYVPSGDVLLSSVAAIYGARAIGVVLTGMGDDGAKGLRALYETGAWTIAQDEATSVVYGMPREAAELGAARQILPLGKIAPVLAGLAAGARQGR